MTKKMLIDATHEEETRVAVVENNRLIEFDYESQVRRQLKGNIYLAKVTRVEPSLQAAFVNFGGNRHGFLPFSEIHPDYFKIPVDDREALIAAQKEALEEHDEIFSDDAADDSDDDSAPDEDIADDVTVRGEIIDVEDDDRDDVEEVGGSDKPLKEEEEEALDEAETSLSKTKKRPVKKVVKKTSKKQEEEDDSEPVPDEETIGNLKPDDNEKSDEELDAEAAAKLADNPDSNDEYANGENRERSRGRGRGRYNNKGRAKGRMPMRAKRDEKYEESGRDSGKPFRFNLHHRYKIQEVVKRGQIMLIQVSKEERGNKGAAVTTYLSLPGRYCVLMPNSPRGGGVSRKIGNYKDRRKMRDILKELEVPEGMSVILRTAGVARTGTEIKRDLDYLTRLWNTIREETLQSTAPAVINEEGNLIKRSIRDIYTRDVESIEVAGSKGYKAAKKTMQLLIPSHAKKVIEYKDDKVPLFHRYQVERQIADIGETTAKLKSGGYLVINPTEALVSIDVNSGKATKERHIEETALKTNLESADEVARQLRLRDLGGLVVIDFIDMEDRRNNRKVEQRLRDALSIDRARIQVGRISSFGLLELSRQRLNPSLTEAQFEPCAHCQGRGSTMTLDFAAITALRGIEELGIHGKVKELSLLLPNNVAVYILNKKRDMLTDIEARYDFKVHINVDDELRPSEYRVDVIEGDKNAVQKAKAESAKQATQQKQQPKVQPKAQPKVQDDEEGEEKPKKGRRRGRRGGRRRNKNNEQNGEQNNTVNTDKSLDVANEKDPLVPSNDEKGDEKLVEKEIKKRTARKPQESKNDSEGMQGSDTKEPVKKPAKKAAIKKVAKTSKKTTETDQKSPSNDTKSEGSVEMRDRSEYEVVNEAPKKKKKGWWNRLVE
ncbi:MAG: Rne/Rng family ribonuclease [Alphaproteobacteria bacterium]|nr:Rne/Rng family ribonuclease [Alphaproteobacteria bacterium]NCQ88712.1 Rne/Rng family ribonuclease [Alphaproteobacteria bacterium]NCT08190.1 Rne/Rng family ribonuclease [Alphaproteobacteria bacterium]